MSTYAELQNKRVETIAQFLASHPDEGMNRARLAKHLSTPTMRITGTMVTALWPRIEARIISIGEENGIVLFPVRPMTRWGFKCAATTAPYHSVWMATRREAEQVTRMRNDAIGGLSEHLMKYGHLLDREQEREVWRRIDRRDAYLAAYDKHIADLEDVAGAMLSSIVNLPEISV